MRTLVGFGIGILISCSSCVTTKTTKADPASNAMSRSIASPEANQCLSCHKTAVPTDDGKEMPAQREDEFSRPYIHGGRTVDSCEYCHVPHKGHDGTPFKGQYPLNYANGDKPLNTKIVKTYGLCFSCHDASLLNRKMKDWDTMFRQGSRNKNGKITQKNLHWFHIVKSDGITCSSCHEAHSANQPFLLKEAAVHNPYKRQRLFYNRSCTVSCHTRKDNTGDPLPYRYDR